jgi:hypothetical protein
LPDWSARFHQWLDQAAREPMEWGRTDCALTAAAAVEALTGKHPAPGLVGSYKTERGALGALKRLGGLDTLATKFLGEPLPTWKLAQRGDLVLFGEVDLRGAPSVDRLGVCVGAQIAARAELGLTFRPMRQARVAWPVGAARG